MPVDAVMIGAGGFGREVLDVVEAQNTMNGPESDEFIRILGVVDDSPSAANLDRLIERGFLHLGGIGELINDKKPGHYLLGIGDPKIKQRIAEKLENAGWQPLIVIHPNAVVGSVREIGAGAIICAGVQLSTNTRLSRHVHLNPNSTIGHDTILQDYVSVNPGAIVSGEVTVGTQTLVGAGAIILQQLSIGEESIIGAAACVTSSVADRTTVVGVPARPISRTSLNIVGSERKGRESNA